MIKTFEATLTKRQELAQDINLFSFEIVNDTLAFEAGQYVIVLIKQPDGTTARRLYSVASSPANSKGFDLLLKRVPGGVASNFFAGLHVGEKATFQGPAGVFTLKDSVQTAPKVFLATSTGIAPIYAMLRAKIDAGVTNESWHLFWGVRTSHDLYWLKEFEEMKQKNPRFTYSYCLSREPELSQKSMPAACVLGRFDAHFKKLIVDPAQKNPQVLNGYEYYVCGSVNAVEAVRQFLIGEGVDKKQIRSEKFI